MMDTNLGTELERRVEILALLREALRFCQLAMSFEQSSYAARRVSIANAHAHAIKVAVEYHLHVLLKGALDAVHMPTLNAPERLQYDEFLHPMILLAAMAIRT